MIFGSSEASSVRMATEHRSALTFQQREHFVDDSVHVEHFAL